MKRIDLFFGCNYNDYIKVVIMMKISSCFFIVVYILFILKNNLFLFCILDYMVESVNINLVVICKIMLYLK